VSIVVDIVIIADSLNSCYFCRFSPEQGSILAKATPNAKLVYFEKSAHELAEEMREVTRVITEFLLQPGSAIQVIRF